MMYILLCYGLQSLFAVRDLLHSALAIEVFYGSVNFATGKLFHDFLERRILLANDFVEVCGSHSGLLQLVVRPSGLDGFMLTHVTYEQHAVFGAESLQEVIDLSGAGQARFIQHVEMLFSGIGLQSSGEVVLQRVGLNSGFCQLVRSPRSGRQAFDTVTFAVSGVTDGAQRGRLAGSGYTF